jgi:hypothetical protein
LAAEYGGPEIENRRARRSDPRTLVGGLEGGVLQLLDRADKDGGERYCATYELSDPDLIKHLTALGKKKLHLVLSNADEDTEDGSGDGDSTNTDAWSELHSLGLDVDDRMLKKGPIGHNKFVVYVDANGTVAEAYAAHVLDVYEHHRWRWKIQTPLRDKFAELKKKNPKAKAAEIWKKNMAAVGESTINKVWKNLEPTDAWQGLLCPAQESPRRETNFWSSFEGVGIATESSQPPRRRKAR